MTSRTLQCEIPWQLTLSHRNVAIYLCCLTRHPGQMHELEDDIGSFVHVLGWTILPYLQSPMGRNTRTDLVSSLYDHGYGIETGQEEGVCAKALHFKSGDYSPEEFTLMEHSLILKLMRNLASPFRAPLRQTVPLKETRRYSRFPCAATS